MSVQFNHLYQPDAAGSTQAAACPAGDALQPAQHSLPAAAGGSAGLAQVERALLKLQTLRNTLQSIGSSAASSRQHSLRASRTVSASGGTAVCSPEASSGQLLGGMTVQSSSAEAVTVSHEGAAAGAGALLAERSSSGVPASAREWIKQLSQRIQQAGTGETSTAAQLEEAVASLQAQQADTAAADAEAAIDSEAAVGSAAVRNSASSSHGSPAVQSNLVADTAADGATTALVFDPCLESVGHTGVSRCSSRVGQRADTPLLKLLDTGCPSEASEESACSPAVAAAAAAAVSAAAAVAAAAACQETAADAEVSTLAAELGAGSVATPTGSVPSNPWVARLAMTGLGSPNWSTATATSVSTAEDASQPQGIAYKPSTLAGSNAAAGVQQQPASNLSISCAEVAIQGAGPESPSTAPHLVSNQQHPKLQDASGEAEATSAAAAAPVAAGEVAVAGSEGAVAVPPAGRLQHVLDASDDTALLLSLAFKLDMLAKKFGGQVGTAHMCHGSSFKIATLNLCVA
jgi:hypothetical protein